MEENQKNHPSVKAAKIGLFGVIMTIIAGFGYILLEDYLKRDEVKIIQSYDESKSGKDSTIEKPIPTTTPKDENSILKKAEVIVYKLKGIKRKAGTNYCWLPNCICSGNSNKKRILWICIIRH